VGTLRTDLPVRLAMVQDSILSMRTCLTLIVDLLQLSYLRSEREGKTTGAGAGWPVLELRPHTSLRRPHCCVATMHYETSRRRPLMSGTSK